MLALERFESAGLRVAAGSLIAPLTTSFNLASSAERGRPSSSQMSFYATTIEEYSRLLSEFGVERRTASRPGQPSSTHDCDTFDTARKPESCSSRFLIDENSSC